MNLRKNNINSSFRKPSIPKAQYPNVEILLKRLKSAERIKFDDINIRNYNYSASRRVSKPHSSMSQRSGSLDKSTMNLSINSNEDCSNENQPGNKQLNLREDKKSTSIKSQDLKRTEKSNKTICYPLEKDITNTINSEVSTFEKKVLENGKKIFIFLGELFRTCELGIKIPTVTAKSWAIYDVKTNEFLFGCKENLKREVASLTKIMTCYVVSKLIKEYNVDAKNTYIQVSQMASSMNGTSANLQAGDVLSVFDLLHGMMLPSGNDAAYSLAESFGTYIYMKTSNYKERMKLFPETTQQKLKNSIKFFLDLMNKCAEELKMYNTYYANAHGLMNHQNKSTASDISRLCVAILKDDLLKQIVSTKKYTCEIEQSDNSIRNVTWENTNKLLNEGWTGVKTGITPAAGPCLSASYTDELGNQYVVTLLCAYSMDIRWEEANKLIKWVIENKRLPIFK